MAGERITVLVEDTAGGRDLLAEHGLSLWIEVDEKRILFDTGQSTVLRDNARRLGVRLERIDAVVLSHGHYDHTGGLDAVLRQSDRPVVYAHPAAFAAKYARLPDGQGRAVGVPDLDELSVRERADLVWVEEPTQVCDRVHVTGPVPRTTGYEDTGGPFFSDQRCTVPDPMVDDQAAFIETPSGTTVILGCAHAGVINTLRYVQTLTGGRPIHTVIGGMHLLRATPERMNQTVAELRRLQVRRLLPCHCTGFEATARLWKEFPGSCHVCPVGTVVEGRA